MSIKVTESTEFQGVWDEPRELLVTVGGVELARGDINAFKVELGTQRCSNDDCIGSIEDEVMGLWFKVAPPKEPKL